MLFRALLRMSLRVLENFFQTDHHGLRDNFCYFKLLSTKLFVAKFYSGFLKSHCATWWVTILRFFNLQQSFTLFAKCLSCSHHKIKFFFISFFLFPALLAIFHGWVSSCARVMAVYHEQTTHPSPMLSKNCLSSRDKLKLDLCGGEGVVWECIHF